MSWRDVIVVIRQASPMSALARALDPEAAVWTFEAHLLAGVIDALNVANWQRGGGKGKRPRPIKRPGVVDANSRTLGKDPLPVDEMADWLGGAFAAAER